MIELNLVGVRVELPTNTPILLLKEAGGERFLPIFIGPAEAHAIVTALQGHEPPRPMTHDLLKNILDELGAVVEHIAINDLKDSTFFANIRLNLGSHAYEITSRPSDAIALAVRIQVPIYAAEEVLEEASIRIEGSEAQLGEGRSLLDQTSEAELERFREFLEQVSPEDFRQQ
ncbi:MAG: bifunctional nuclease family protein [Actinomycetota bacterium]